MGSFKVKRLDLPINVIENFERQNLHTCKDVLCLTIVELQTLLGISREEAKKIQFIVNKKCVSDPYSVYDLLKEKKYRNPFFPTSLDGLDVLLQGGLPIGSVTEISGPPGVGKTQFCFLLCLLATLPTHMGGLDGQVIYIDTESAFSAGRLKEMAEHRYPAYFLPENISCMFQRIFVHKASSVCALKKIIPNIETEIIKKKVKLVIVDSIASLFRKEYGSCVIESVVERNNILLEQAAILKDIAQTYDIVVFLTNQITSHSADCDPVLSEYFSSEENGHCRKEPLADTSESFQPHAKKLKRQEAKNAESITPALGVTWFHCVNTRLVAQFVSSQIRQLIIEKSPVAPNAAVRYILNETGIVMTDDDIEYVTMTHNEQQSILTKHHFLNEEITGCGTVFSINNAVKY